MVATDTASYSDTVFGLFRLLGYRFSPRIAGVAGSLARKILHGHRGDIMQPYRAGQEDQLGALRNPDADAG